MVPTYAIWTLPVANQPELPMDTGVVEKNGVNGGFGIGIPSNEPSSNALTLPFNKAATEKTCKNVNLIM
jgi:hypothetical protein